jgi:hypothetical protein
MKSSEFIIFKIKDFVIKFPQAYVKYEHDEASFTHFLEVTPLALYQNDEEYIQWELAFQSEFIANYPDENIGFISEDALVGLDRVDFELAGEVNLSSISVCNKNTTIISELNFANDEYWENPLDSVNVACQANNMQLGLDLHFRKLANVDKVNHISDQWNLSTVPVGESNYAMAA